LLSTKQQPYPSNCKQLNPFPEEMMLPTQAKETIIELLAQGVPTSQVALTVGCTDAYISQLKADPEVQELLVAKASGRLKKDSAFDSKLETAEELALARIEAGLQFANLGQAVGAFRVLNGAKRRKDVTADNSTGTTVNVTLTLPANALPRYTLNGKNEIVDVEGKTMVAATPKSLETLLRERAQLAVAVEAPAEQAKTNMLLGNLTVPVRRPPSRITPDMIADLL
jgi:hypothetical protein